jgi:LAO/AO transport system kinase
VKQQAKPRLSVESLATGIVNGDRILLAQAITLIESQREDDQVSGGALLEKIMPHTGKSIRLGITGVPGVGKSTFIEALGHVVLKKHKKVAVLSIDPTSPIGGGSILGDKTRMEALSKHPMAFIRPSASLDAVGGVAQRTRECMLLCEAAGYDLIIVETVGVGQSEYAVKDMVDFFLLLMLAGAGDDLQGMKKGIMELADAVAITKADGDNIAPARRAQATYAQALHTVNSHSALSPPVLLTSALSGIGMEDTWTAITKFIADAQSTGSFDKHRRHQYAAWLREQFNNLLKADLQKFEKVRTAQTLLEADVMSGNRSPRSAATELLAAYKKQIRE